MCVCRTNGPKWWRNVWGCRFELKSSGITCKRVTSSSVHMIGGMIHGMAPTPCSWSNGRNAQRCLKSRAPTWRNNNTPVVIVSSEVTQWIEDPWSFYPQRVMGLTLEFEVVDWIWSPPFQPLHDTQQRKNAQVLSGPPNPS
jgi:hypothetical protein